MATPTRRLLLLAFEGDCCNLVSKIELWFSGIFGFLRFGFWLSKLEDFALEEAATIYQRLTLPADNSRFPLLLFSRLRSNRGPL